MLKGWRTRIINMIFAIVAILSLPELHSLVPPEYLSWLLLAVAVINIGLRQITTTPPGQRE